MQKTHRNILIALVVGVAVVGGVMASGGNLFQGKLLKVPSLVKEVSVDSPKPFKDPGNVKPLVDCSRVLLYDNTIEGYDFGDFWNSVNLDLGNDDKPSCSYQVLAFNDIDRNDGVGYICGGTSLTANPAEGEGDAARIICEQTFAKNNILSVLVLGANNLEARTAYGLDASLHNGNFSQFMNTNEYAVYRVPKDWYADPNAE